MTISTTIKQAHYIILTEIVCLEHESTIQFSIHYIKIFDHRILWFNVIILLC